MIHGNNEEGGAVYGGRQREKECWLTMMTTGAEGEAWRVATGLAAARAWPDTGLQDRVTVAAEQPAAAAERVDRPDADRTDPDRAEVEAARTGDAGAFEVLVIRYQVRIVSYAAAIVRDAGVAEDVAQETFVRVWKGLPSFRGESAFKTWLYRIASNVARTQLERSGRQARVGSESLDDEDAPLRTGDVSSGAADVETTLAAREAINHALAQLPAELRVAVVLRDVEGLDYKEIAEVTGAPLGTVESRIFRARRRLRSLLQSIAGR